MINSIARETTIKESGDMPVRKQDLSTRERVNFVVDSLIMEKLRNHAKNTKTPMSRIIDLALTGYLNCNTNMSSSNTAGKLNDIVLQHLIEIIVYESYNNNRCIELFKKIEECSLNYIYTSCLLNLDSPQDTVLGTKVFLFVSDRESDNLSSLLNYIVSIKNCLRIDINLDFKELKY